MKNESLEEYLISRERKIIKTRRINSLESIEDSNPLDEDVSDSLFNWSESNDDNTSNER